MVTIERVGLQFLIIILIRISINATLPLNSFGAENVLGILSNLLGKRTRGPVIIILEKSVDANALRISNNKNQLDAGAKKSPFDDTIEDEKTKRYVKAILRSTGDENDPIVKRTNTKFKNALRDRCAEFAKCESTCELKKKKKKDDCERTCKEVFDYLMICHPPGGAAKKKKETKPKKTKKKDSCESSSLDCGEAKDSCEQADSCAPSKNSCEPSDECKIDSCASNECVTEEPKKKFGTGKTMPPKWRH